MNPENEYIVLTGLVFLLIAVFIGSYSFVRFIKRTKYLNISLDKIQPYFSYGSPMKTSALECSFRIDSKKTSSYLSEVVPLTYFLGSDDGFIIFDIGVDLPILYTTGEKIIGEEAIEHFLLQKKSYLTVKFISGNYIPGDYKRGNVPSEKLY